MKSIPMVTGILLWLTPLAAVGLAITVLMAAGFNFPADERLAALEIGLWASIAAVIAIGRRDLVRSYAYAQPWVLVAALGLLVPSVIINLIVLFKRAVKGGTPGPASELVHSEPRGMERRLKPPRLIG